MEIFVQKWNYSEQDYLLIAYTVDRRTDRQMDSDTDAPADQ